MIELAIVILIGGIIMAAGAQAVGSYMKNINRKITKDRISAIVEQIDRYLEENERLPCVARRNDNPSSATFARALDDDGVPGGAIGCTLTGPAPPAAPAVVSTAAGGDVFIGAVPTRTLNLPDTFLTDAWGNRFQYAVTRTQTNSFVPGSGRIHVRDTNNNPVVLPAGRADFVIFSTGDNKRGGWAMSGQSMNLACAAVPASDDDRENCDGDAVFVTTLTTADGTVNLYDDIVQYKRIPSKNIVIPAEAVVPIERLGPDADTCPAGWQKPVPAIPNNGNLVYCKKI